MTPTENRMRDAIQHLPGSKIRLVANASLGRSEVLPFWFGENDAATPQAIRLAAGLLALPHGVHRLRGTLRLQSGVPCDQLIDLQGLRKQASTAPVGFTGVRK